MEFSAELKNGSRHQNMSRVAKEKIPLHLANNRVKLRDELKTEKFSNQSNKDLHCRTKQERVPYKVRRDDDHMLLIRSKSSHNHKKLQTNSVATQNDELVKHMSNLPFYLQHVERKTNLQEQALNFGVLDWGRLEKWKYNKKQITNRSTTYDPSASNSLSSLTTVGSSTLSGRGHCRSSAHQRKQSNSSFSNLKSPKDEANQSGKSNKGNVSDLQGTRTAPKSSSFGKFLAAEQSLCQNSNMKLQKKHKRKDSDPKIIPEKKTSSSRSKDCAISFCPKGEMKVPDGESERRAEQLRQLTFNLPDNPCPGRHKNIILILPTDCSRNSSSGISKRAEPPTSVDVRSAEANRKSFSDCLRHKEEVHLADNHSDVPYSCPLLCRVEGSQESDMKLADSLCAQGTEVPSDACGLAVTPDEVPNGKDSDVEENKPSSSITVEPLYRLDPKAAEVKNFLPNHQPSIGLGRISRSFSFKGVSTIPQLRSSYVTAKSGPARSDVLACSDDSARDKPNANTRGRSSPLRRLLDPLFKPKAGNCPEPLLKESMSNHRACKSSDGHLDSSTVHSVKRNLNLSSCGSVNADDSCPSEKHVESTMHALMQVTVKNGLPLFTFVLDSATDVLAATMTKASTTMKESNNWVYTIYTVCEVKKKSGRWVNQGSKGKNHGYASTVVGQMKVSLSQCPMLNRDNFKDHFQVREFVLFGVELRPADQEILDFHPSSELAAMVVKLPEENLGNFRNKDLSDMGLSSYMEEGRCLCNTGENLESEHSAGTERVTSTLVVLPSGLHSLPSTGMPSSLVDRWKSGGSCDCGGWDMGCKLRILSNQGWCSENFISSKASSTSDRFDLFIQGGSEQNKPVFSLVPFEKGIYSVDFHGSLTLLQAFSICLAVISNRKPYDLLEVSNMFEAKGPHDTMSIENDRINAHAEVEHASYVPPLSPVGRI